MITKQSTTPPEAVITSLHGVFLNVMGFGVMLYGPSGIGKSELALGLIQRGHRLIADDIAWFNLDTDGQFLYGRCPPLLQDFLEVRGLGILDIRAMFGDAAICAGQRLDLMIELQHFDNLDPHQLNRIHGVVDSNAIAGIAVPYVLIPVAPARGLSLLVEAAVRNQRLKANGYDASLVFASRQATLLKEKPHHGC